MLAGMAFPLRPNFLSPAYRAAWFQVDAIWTRDDGSHACQPYIVQTEGLQAVILMQRALRDALQARKARGPIQAVRCGTQTLSAPQEVLIDGRIGPSTVAAIATLSDPPPNVCNSPDYQPWRSAWYDAEVSQEFLVAGLNYWVRSDARMQAQMAALKGIDASRLFVIGCVLQPDTIPPLFGLPPQTPRHILAPHVSIELETSCADDPTLIV